MSNLLIVRGTTELTVTLADGSTTLVVAPTGTRTSLVVAGGPPGPRGAAGIDGADARISAVAAVDLGTGTPVAIDRATGQFIAADASFKPKAFVAGLLDAAVMAGFVGNAAPTRLTLSDWTAITGSALLSRGVPYFLNSGGGLTTSPPSGACVTLVGEALDTVTLLIDPQPPIEL